MNHQSKGKAEYHHDEIPLAVALQVSSNFFLVANGHLQGGLLDGWPYMPHQDSTRPMTMVSIVLSVTEAV